MLIYKKPGIKSVQDNKMMNLEFEKLQQRVPTIPNKTETKKIIEEKKKKKSIHIQNKLK